MSAGKLGELAAGLLFTEVLKVGYLDAIKHKVRNWAHALRAGLNRLGYIFQLGDTTLQRKACLFA